MFRCTSGTLTTGYEFSTGVLKSVVHSWDDQRAGTILWLCRDVIPEHGGLLIIEPVLPEAVDGSIPAMMYLSDEPPGHLRCGVLPAVAISGAMGTAFRVVSLAA